MFAIKDRCRKNLNPYTLDALSHVPRINDPNILDIGCGTGIPALAVLKQIGGRLTAIDPDLSSIEQFRRKISGSDNITLIHDAIENISLPKNSFDIILAEGVLHIIGWETGLALLSRYTKLGGYCMVHDELAHSEKHRALISRHRFQQIYSFTLDTEIWWNQYFSCLESQIKQLDVDHLSVDMQDAVQKEAYYINMFKEDPAPFQSVYYVLKKPE